MTVDADKIMQAVKTIVASEVPNKEKYFEPIYKSLKDQYPQLYALACKSDASLDLKPLEFMLGMMTKINKNETSQSDASVAVGQALFDQFIDVSKLTPSTNAPGTNNFKITTSTTADP